MLDRQPGVRTLDLRWLRPDQRLTGGLNNANGLIEDLYFTSTIVPCKCQSSCDHTPNGVTIHLPFTLYEYGGYMARYRWAYSIS